MWRNFDHFIFPMNATNNFATSLDPLAFCSGWNVNTKVWQQFSAMEVTGVYLKFQSLKVLTSSSAFDDREVKVQLAENILERLACPLLVYSWLSGLLLFVCGISGINTSVNIQIWGFTSLLKYFFCFPFEKITRMAEASNKVFFPIPLKIYL